MLARSALLLGRRGWLYLAASAACLAPLALFRALAPSVWTWTGLVGDGPRDDLISSGIFVGSAYVACTVLAMASVPGLVLGDLSGVRIAWRSWVSGCLGPFLFFFCASPLLFLLSMATFGMCVLTLVPLLVDLDALGPSAMDYVALVLCCAIGLGLPLLIVGNVFLRGNGRAVQETARRFPAEALEGPTAVHRRRLLFLGFPLLTAYVSLPAFIEFEHRIALDPGTVFWWLFAAEALLLTLWAVVATASWHATYGRVYAPPETELADAFD